ncbi:MAG: formate/nitrite transporter family protein [Neisseriaceae bacterium]
MSNENEVSSFSSREKIAVEEHDRLSPRLLYEIIRRNGLEELVRPEASLIFSGIAAGIVISFSFLFKAVLGSYLPHTQWAPIISNLGYAVGFILVILGRMQLFTENTITTVVPLFNPLTLKKALSVLKLWSIVLVSNLIGTTLAALFFQSSYLLDPAFIHELNNIVQGVVQQSGWENLWRGIPAGVMIASLVWMLPTSKSYAFFLILFFTYLIGLGNFSHIVVGSTEVMYWVLQGKVTLGTYFSKFLVPTGIGNVIGGTFIFTMLIYVQVLEEIRRR